MSSTRRTVAVLLSIVLPSCGHFAIGRFRRGLVFSVLFSLANFGALDLCSIGYTKLIVGYLVGIALLWVASIVDVVLLSRNVAVPPRPAVVVLACVALVAVANIEAHAYRAHVLETFLIPSGSMVPTLLPGDRIAVDKHGTPPEPGNVVVYTSVSDPSKDFVKRVVAVAGDVVETRGGVPFVNGAAVKRVAAGPCTYDDVDDTQHAVSHACDAFDEQLGWHHYRVVEETAAEPRDVPASTVPAGHFYVLGDNRRNSFDSRWTGPIPADHVKGIARFVYFGRAGLRGLEIR